MNDHARIDAPLESSSVCLANATGKVIAEATAATESEALLASFELWPNLGDERDQAARF